MADSHSDPDTIGGKFPSELGGGGGGGGGGGSRAAPVKVNREVGTAAAGTYSAIMDYRNYGGGVGTIPFSSGTPVNSAFSGTTINSMPLSTNVISGSATITGLGSPTGRFYWPNATITDTFTFKVSASGFGKVFNQKYGSLVVGYPTAGGATSYTVDVTTLPYTISKSFTATGAPLEFAFNPPILDDLQPVATYSNGTSIQSHEFNGSQYLASPNFTLSITAANMNVTTAGSGWAELSIDMNLEGFNRVDSTMFIS